MTQKLTLICVFLSFSVGITNAQKEIECKTKLSLFHESVKAKKYDEALTILNASKDTNS